MNFPTSVRRLLVCAAFLSVSCQGKKLRNPQDAFLDDDRMDETSGIAASVVNPGYFYVHNDSGDSSRFFAIKPDGHLRAIFYFNGDPNLGRLGVKDCEDIAVGEGPDSGVSYVYVGDIGDNFAHRKYITIYRIKEPGLPADTATRPVLAGHLHADPLFLRYPDGPRDAETLMVDPIDKLLYIVSKREDSVHVYSTALNFKAQDTVTLTENCHLYFSGKGKWITAGDISHKGDQILMKSYRKVYYWRRPAGEPVWKTLQHTPSVLPYIVEQQGEAIGFTIDGKSYYCVSEGVRPELFYYKIPQVK
jgi:hypothetical protein